MRVAVVYNAVGEGAGADERDVLDQLDAVVEALAALGHRVEAIPCDLDLAALERRLAAARPELVFNLVEALAGSERLSHCVPALLDTLGLPYTGAPTEAIFLTANKLLAKAWLTALGLPTPPVAAAWPALPSLLAGGAEPAPGRSSSSRCGATARWASPTTPCSPRAPRAPRRALPRWRRGSATWRPGWAAPASPRATSTAGSSTSR